MRLGDTEVEILISGQPAKEYTDDDFEQEPLEDEASKYIEAVEGSNFAFRCTLHPSYKFAPAIDYLCFTFSVDGEQVTGKVVTPEEISQGRTASKMRGGGGGVYWSSSRPGRGAEISFRQDRNLRYLSNTMPSSSAEGSNIACRPYRHQSRVRTSEGRVSRSR